MVPRARVAGIRAPVGLVQDGVQDAAEQRPIAEAILAAFGWPASQFACLDPFWEREPGWSVTAAPQWSPPTSGGSTRAPSRLPARGSRAAMEPVRWAARILACSSTARRAAAVRAWATISIVRATRSGVISTGTRCRVSA